MSRIKSDKVNYTSSIVVDFSSEIISSLNEDKQEEEQRDIELQNEQEQRLLEFEQQAKDIISEANIKAEQILLDAQTKLQEANLRAQEIIQEAQKNAEQVLSDAQEEIKKQTQEATSQGAKEGYEFGYKDGSEKIHQELEDKIQQADDIVKSANEAKDKMFFAAKKELVELVTLIAKKVCVNCADSKAILALVEKSFELLSEKEHVELIISKKYSEFFKDALGAGDELENSDFLKNIKLVYNSKMPDDTLIVQTPKERLDLSFEAQIDKIAQAFFKELTQLSKDEEN